MSCCACYCSVTELKKGHGEEKAASPHRGNGSQDPGVPGAQVPTPGLPEVRAGLRDHEAASHGEDAACACLAGRPEGESSLLTARRHEDVWSGSPPHKEVLAGGPQRAQLLADHQGEGGSHS